MGFLAAGFLAAGFLAAGFLVAFLAAGFLAAFLAAGFLAAFLGFLAAGFFAFLTFLAFGFFSFLTFFAFFSTAASLKEPAPFLPAAAAATTFLAAINFLRARRTRTAALAASTLLLATTYLRMAWRDDPFLSPSPLMAAAIMAAYGGWAAGTLGLAAFLALGAAAASDMFVLVGRCDVSPM